MDAVSVENGIESQEQITPQMSSGEIMTMHH
jgi:hypothetical protein